MLSAMERWIQRNKALFFPFLLIILSLSCKTSNSSTPIIPQYNQIIILYTNDEHGWMEATDTHGGAMGMMGLWKTNHNFTDESPFLVLSGGDMWTGPAISTWTQGQAMCDVMNQMGYDAVAIGNHEFDFSIDVLNQRRAQLNFPLLAANIRHKETGEIPAFAIPYIIREVNGVRIGVIGLSSLSTPLSTSPENVKDYDFIEYDDALQETVPLVRAAGAELLIVIAHICYSEMQDLAPIAAELGISLIGGGHCHELFNTSQNGVNLIQANAYMKYYIKVDISFDTATDTVISINPTIYENSGGVPDTDMEALVAFWRNEVDSTLGEVIGFADQEIHQSSDAMYNLVTDSWLDYYPNGQISFCNTGGIRQSIPAGNITLGTLVGVLPFEDYLYELELTGSQVISCIGDLVMGGMTTIGGFQLLDGSTINPNDTYKVLTIDYLYSRTDYCFQYNDTTPYDTAIHYRQPVINWIRSLNTTAANPLNNYLNHTPRK